MSKINVYRELVDNGFPGPVMRYFYLTKVEGKNGPYDWKADVEDEVAECWEDGDKFVWDDEPCGMGIKEEDIPKILENAFQIGYIDSDTKELTITEKWKVPVSYGYINGRNLVTEWERAGAGV